MNTVARDGIDGDGIARSGCDIGRPGAVVDDADRVNDGHRAIAGGVEHVDLAAGSRYAEREGKSPARRGARAGAAIGFQSRYKCPVWSRLRRRGGKTAGEKRRGDGRKRCDLDHGCPPSNAEKIVVDIGAHFARVPRATKWGEVRA